MKYSLMSDLHVNFHTDNTLEIEPDVVVVAGDTANCLRESMAFLRGLELAGKKVIAVSGNHEHYAYSYDSLEQQEAFFQQKFPAVNYVGDVVFLGCNGWYLVESEQHWRGYMRDAKYVSVNEVNAAAERQASWLNSELEKLDGKKAVVVTHTAPSRLSLDPRFEGQYGNQYFHSPLLHKVLKRNADKILCWHHGHTHAPMDVVDHGVRIITNPRGYPGELDQWAPMTLTL